MRKIKPAKEIISCDEGERVWELFELFINGYRKIPVVGEGKKLTGIVCGTDFLDFLGAGEKHQHFMRAKRPLSVKVKDIMTEKPYTIKDGLKQEDIMELFVKTGKGSFPVVSRGRIKGMVSEWDIVKSSDFGHKQVREIMTKKPFSARKTDTVYDVAKMMVRGGYRRLPITDDGILIGVVTPSDIIHHIYKAQKAFSFRKDKTPIENIMKRSILAVRPETSIKKTAELMEKRKIGGLPVIEDGELLGLITERDIVNLVLTGK